MPTSAMDAAVTTGLFTLGGALIGTGVPQIVAVVKVVSKSNARKRKAQRKRRDANAATRRELYSDFIGYLRSVAEIVNHNRRALSSIGTAQAANRPVLLQRMARVLDAATGIQIDGSKDALKIATDVLNGTSELRQLLADGAAYGKGPLDAAYPILVKAETDMIELSRKEFGADAS